MTLRRLFNATLVLGASAMFVAAPATAQSSNTARPDAFGARLADTITIRKPIDSARTRAADLRASPVPLPRPAGETRATALMIVGAAAFITGSLIGHESGRIIMVGGAVLGLYGLWRYLQ